MTDRNKYLGVSCAFPSFVCAMTQFLDSSDLRQLECVSRADKTALDTLWRTCARLYQGYGVIPPCVHLLREQPTVAMGPLAMSRPYLWSIACLRIQSYLQTCEGHSHSLSFLIRNEHSLANSHCDKRCPFYSDWDEYVLDLTDRTDITNIRHWVSPGTGNFLHHALTCRRLQYIWGPDILNRVFPRSTTTTTTTYKAREIAPTLLRVLVRNGLDLSYCYVPRVQPWATLWFTLDVAPRLPLHQMSDQESMVLKHVSEFGDRIDRFVYPKGHIH